MAKVKRNTKAVLRLKCDDPEDSFVVTRTTMGEPFREGINIGIRNDDYDKEVTVMLENREAERLRDLLLEHYPIKLKTCEKALEGRDEIQYKTSSLIHYPECWDTVAYPTLLDAIKEIGCNPEDCTHEN